jgi:hypothetical protein
MADDSFGRRIPFAFLQDIKEKFLTQYGRERALSSLVPYGMNEFSKTIAKQMVNFINALCTRSFIFFLFPVAGKEGTNYRNGWMQMERRNGKWMEYIGSCLTLLLLFLS